MALRCALVNIGGTHVDWYSARVDDLRHLLSHPIGDVVILKRQRKLERAKRLDLDKPTNLSVSRR